MKQIPEISPTFCVYPWMETILDVHGVFAPCCAGEAIKNKKGRVYNLVEDRLEDFWNSWGLREIRRKMLEGEKVPECKWCYYQESIGQTSYRKDHNKEWLESKYAEDILDRVEKSKTNGYRVKEPPLHLDIRPTNLCNLKCRMCSPASSSKIEQEQKEMLQQGGDTSFVDVDYFKVVEKYSNWHKNKKIWDTVYKWGPGLKKIDFLGGEPVLIKENWKLINYLKEKGWSKNIKLLFSINCTQKPDKIIDTFESFGFVHVMFSVDGYREVNDYIRFPSKWKEIENNVTQVLKHKRENAFFSCSIVVQVYNILDLPSLLQWIDKLDTYLAPFHSHLMMCRERDFLNIDILPENVRKTALLKIKDYEKSYNKNRGTPFLKQIDSIKNVLNSEENPDIEKHLKNFYKYTKILDRHRGNSFERTFPELDTLLNEDGRWKA